MNYLDQIIGIRHEFEQSGFNAKKIILRPDIYEKVIAFCEDYFHIIKDENHKDKKTMLYRMEIVKAQEPDNIENGKNCRIMEHEFLPYWAEFKIEEM